MFHDNLQVQCVNSSVCLHFRLIAEQGEELKMDQLSKDLKTLANQAKATKYREVMKLLRLVLSGLQVPEHIVFILMTDINTKTLHKHYTDSLQCVTDIMPQQSLCRSCEVLRKHVGEKLYKTFCAWMDY